MCFRRDLIDIVFASKFAVVRRSDRRIIFLHVQCRQEMCSSAKLHLQRKANMAQSCRYFRHDGGTLGTNVMHEFNSHVQIKIDDIPISQTICVKRN